jgi:hypothetical protein
MNLDAVLKSDDFEVVTVSTKVVGIEGSVQVGSGLMKQDVYVSDSTATIKLTLWEEDVGKLIDGSSYLLNDVLVRSYNGVKYQKGHQ